MMRDAEFGMIRLRAFGTYAMKIADAKAFFAAIVGTAGLTTTDEITGQLRSTILSAQLIFGCERILHGSMVV